MASILEDLKGILSPAEYAKLEAKQDLATRLTRGDELRSYYDGDEPPPVAHVDPPPVVRSTPAPPGAFDLTSIERMLDAREQKQRDFIKTELDNAVKSRGDEFVNNTVKIAVQRADELNRIYARHSELTGKPFDSADFNAFLEKPEIKAKGFRTLNDAYEAYAAPTVTERTIESEVDKRVKAKQAEDSGKHLPGVTPGPAVNSNVRFFQKRTATGGQAETTGAGGAAAALDKISARRDESAA